MKKSSLFCAIECCALLSIFCSISTPAQVIPDNTLPDNSVVTPQGDVIQITGGETRGGNLFHSFQDFSVQTGNEAFFNNANDISNIFSRVTGGNISNIDGTIRANGSASLFLINPAGIIFGENARLDLGGSFYGSTADSILFEDGEFSASDLENTPVLTINAPIGLGLRDNSGDIVNRSAVRDSAEEVIGLEVNPGNNLAFVANHLNFEGGSLTASGGDIYLGAISESGTVEISENGNLSFAEDVLRGDITLGNGSEIDVRGSGGGNIAIDVRNLNLERGELGISSIRAGIQEESTAIEAQAGDITIDATGSLSLNEAEITNNVELEGFGTSGNVFITTDSLSLLNGGLIATITRGQGDARAVNVTATGDITIDGENSAGFASGVTSRVDLDGEGDAGGVVISTNNLNLTGGGNVSASTFGQGNAAAVDVIARDIIADGEGSAGFASGIFSTVDINTAERNNATGNSGGVIISTNNLNLTNGGRVDASTFGRGDAGAVDITATGDIIADGEGSRGIPSGIFSTVDTFAFSSEERDAISQLAVGDAGGVTVSTNNLNLTAGGSVDASTFAQGDAGVVNVTATGDITADGETSSGVPSGIISRVFPPAVGDAGGVTVSTNNLNLTAGGRVDASTAGQGNAGPVIVTAAGDITIDGQRVSRPIPSEITSRVNRSGKGNSGGVTISTNNLNLTAGGSVAASTIGQGNAGAVNVTATGDITIDGEGFIDGEEFVDDPSGISTKVDSNVEAEGDAGGVIISTNNLILTAGGNVSANTFGQGNANNVTIEATESIIIDGFIEGFFRSGISANALNQNGNGGNIFINTGKLSVANGGTIEATNFDNIGEENPGTGRPGNINIAAENIELTDNARIETATQFAGGESGIINLQVAENIILKNNSFISAKARNNADGGNINIDSRFIIAFPSNGNGSDIIANAERGNGGNININAKSLFGIEERSNNPSTNNINASSEFGLDGVVEIDTPEINPNQGLRELPTAFAVPKPLQGCQASREEDNSSFINTGRGGLPPNPYESLDNSNMFVDVQLPSKWTESSITNTSAPTKTEPIVEADKWIVNKNGNVELVANNDLDTIVWECGDRFFSRE